MQFEAGKNFASHKSGKSKKTAASQNSGVPPIPPRSASQPSANTAKSTACKAQNSIGKEVKTGGNQVSSCSQQKRKTPSHAAGKNVAKKVI